MGFIGAHGAKGVLAGRPADSSGAKFPGIRARNVVVEECAPNDTRSVCGRQLMFAKLIENVFGGENKIYCARALLHARVQEIE